MIKEKQSFMNELLEGRNVTTEDIRKNKKENTKIKIGNISKYNRRHKEKYKKENSKRKIGNRSKYNRRYKEKYKKERKYQNKNRK